MKTLKNTVPVAGGYIVGVFIILTALKLWDIDLISFRNYFAYSSYVALPLAYVTIKLYEARVASEYAKRKNVRKIIN